MKFILLESRGGNYLVVAENVAWLRTAENGQTNVGIVGGQPLLVVGSIEEVAAKIVAASGAEDELAARPAHTAPAIEEAALPEPVCEQVQETVPEVVAENAPEPVIERVRQASPVQRPPQKTTRPLSLAERVARAGGASIKPGTQRFMTMSE